MADQEEQLETQIKVGVGSFVACIILLALIMLQHNLAFASQGTIVLPAGGTYLGPPSPTVAPAASDNEPQPTAQPIASDQGGNEQSITTSDGKFSVPANATWVTIKGRIYSYFFKAPKALKLDTFPNDPYDIYAISWKQFTPQSNVLVGVDNLNASDSKKKYVSVSKELYVEDWWKQFGLKGVGSITQFTNSQGLKGYRAKYLNAANQTPNDDIFFEVPNHPEYVIHLASGIIDKSVFDKIIDSVGWK